MSSEAIACVLVLDDSGPYTSDSADRRRKEFADWKEIQQRTTKRLWVKLKHPSSGGDRISQMEEKEEKEYMLALEKEQSALSRIAELEAQEADLQSQVKELEPYASEHEKLKKQLVDLYKRVFDGPTPGFPEEDEKERLVKETSRRYQDFAAAIANEKRAHALLTKAQAFLMLAAQHAARVGLSSELLLTTGRAILHLGHVGRRLNVGHDGTQ